MEDGQTIKFRADDNKSYSIHISCTDVKWITNFLKDLNLLLLDNPIQKNLLDLTIIDYKNIKYLDEYIDKERKKCVVISSDIQFKIKLRLSDQQCNQLKYIYSLKKLVYPDIFSKITNTMSFNLGLIFQIPQKGNDELIEIDTNNFPNIPIGIDPKNLRIK